MSNLAFRHLIEAAPAARGREVLRLAARRLRDDARAMGKRLRRRDVAGVAAVLRAMMAEGTYLAAAVGLYAAALVGRDLPEKSVAMRPGRGRRSADARPVVLLHGYFHNRSAFTVMARRLRRNGRQHVFTLDLPSVRPSVPAIAKLLAVKIDQVRALTGAAQVDLVGHSLGGLVARYFVQCGGGATMVRNVVTLATPHHGTAWGALWPALGGAWSDFTPGSDLLATLAAARLPKTVRLTALWSPGDYTLLPAEAGALAEVAGARTIRLEHTGHMSMLFSRAVFDAIEHALRDEPGSPEQQGE